MGALQTLFKRYLRKNLPSYLAGTACLLATNYLSVTIPGQIGAAVDVLTTPEKLSAIQPFVFNIAWMGVAVVVVRSLSRVLFFNPGRDVEYRIRRDLFANLLHLPPAFYATQNRGDIISRASSDITWVRALIGFGGLQSINLVFALSLTLWKMGSISWVLTGITLAPIIVGTVIVQGSIRSWYPMMKKNQEYLADISEHVLESLNGVTTIQGFQAGSAFIRELKLRNKTWFDNNIQLKLVQSSILPLVALAGATSVFLLLYFGGPLLENGTLTVGNIATFIALLAALVPYMRSLGWMLSTWQSGRAAADRVLELLDAEPDHPEGTNGQHLSEGVVPNIKVSGLSFAYPDDPDNNILEDISLDLPAGETLGVFGKTGSGKSTLLRVLSRMYAPKRGMITVDGIDICDLDIYGWRRKLSTVPQRPFLFSDSVRSNIALGDSDDQERLDKAVSLASLTQDLPALPDGLNTIVGERGIMLSGGQRQRVALARGLYQGGELILLDDVLSAVDHENEQRLVKALNNFHERSQPSCLIVSNRISAFRHADQIVVLDNGRVVQRGTHGQLIEEVGLYQDAYLAQKEAGNTDGTAPASSTSSQEAKNG